MKKFNKDMSMIYNQNINIYSFKQQKKVNNLTQIQKKGLDIKNNYEDLSPLESNYLSENSHQSYFKIQRNQDIFQID